MGDDNGDEYITPLTTWPNAPPSFEERLWPLTQPRSDIQVAFQGSMHRAAICNFQKALPIFIAKVTLQGDGPVDRFDLLRLLITAFAIMIVLTVVAQSYRYIIKR